MSYSKYTEEDIDEMVFLAKKFGSYRKAALEFGCSYQTVADSCHKRGVHIAGPHVICKKRKQLVVDGHTFYWIDKGYYRGSVNGERLMLADYRYRQMFGKQKPKGTVIMFKDGNRENYNLDNLEFVTTSEFMIRRNSDPSILEHNRKILEDGRNKNFAMEKDKPWLAKRRLQRAWRTRRANDPDNSFALKCVESRRATAESRGYYYTPEQRRRMSEAHKGKTRHDTAMARREAEKSAIRAKLGMNF